MKALFDTSLLVASSLQSHQDHARAAVWMNNARQGQVQAVVSAHSLAEVYSVLTRLPPPQRVAPAVAWQIIEHNILSLAEIVALSGDEYIELLRQLSQNGITGGAVYDAIIARAADKAQVDGIVTFNVKDFRRVYPSLAAQVITP